jgi:hypothetical protein
MEDGPMAKLNTQDSCKSEFTYPNLERVVSMQLQLINTNASNTAAVNTYAGCNTQYRAELTQHYGKYL